MTLLVIDRESESACLKQRIPVVADLAECLSLAHRPKTTHLVQGLDGYGFLLRQEKLSVSGRIGESPGRRPAPLPLHSVFTTEQINFNFTPFIS